MRYQEIWEARADSTQYPLHKSYTTHNLWARQHNRHEDCVYDVDGKEMTLREIHDLLDAQLAIEVS